jgi:hypothetical protein
MRVAALVMMAVREQLFALRGVGRNDDELPIAHAALANDMAGEMLDFRLQAAQQ